LAGCGSGGGAGPASDAGVTPAVEGVDAQDAGVVPVDAGPPPRIYAKRFVVNVRNAPDPEAPRIGYLRGGTILRATHAVPLERGKAGCLGGWWQLETGGYVCNVRDVEAFHGRRPPERPPVKADRDAPLPYEYGLNRRNDTPVYTRLPTDEEAAQYEGYRIPGTAPPPTVARPLGEQAVTRDEASTTAGAAGAGSGQPSGGGEGSAAVADRAEGGGDNAGGGAEPASVNPRGTVTSVRGSEDTRAATNPALEALAVMAEVNAAPGVDAGPPTLASLRGERGSVLLRRMVKGFYVALDREFKVGARRYWRTQSNGYVPYDRLTKVRFSSFQGKVLDGQEWDLPLAWVVVERTAVFTRTPQGALRRTGFGDFHSVFRATGNVVTIRGRDYAELADGRFVERRDVRLVTRVEHLPRGLADGEKWIDVDLSQQTLTAYEGDRPVFSTLVSTGRIIVENDPELDRRTPPGEYRITSKHVTTTMDGDSAVDGPYSIEDVPYVMYFQLAYALHSAFWHNRFGRTKSHGCVNLSPLDAKWVFAWTLPEVPVGWHGAYPTADRPGTRIVIRGETPRG
jgi:hypothetical protein